MNLSMLSYGTGIALACLVSLIGLEIYFLVKQDMFLFFSGVVIPH